MHGAPNVCEVVCSESCLLLAWLLTLLLDSKREKFSQVFSGTEYPYLKKKKVLRFLAKKVRKVSRVGKKKLL